METTGTSRCRPITSAISRIGTPSSATACSADPAGAFSSARRNSARGVEAVHRRPAVGAVADVAGDALVAGDADQGRHEAVVAVAVTGRGTAARPTSGRRGRRGRASAARWPTGSPDRRRGGRRRVGPEPVLLGRHPSRCEPERPRGDEERPIGTRERLAEHLDGAAIGIGGALEVPEKAMSCLNARWITPSDAAAACAGCRGRRACRVDLCSGRGERRGRGVRAGEPDDLMAGADQLGNDGRADPARRAGDENSHERTSRWSMAVSPRVARQGRCQLLSSPYHTMSVAVITYDREHGALGAGQPRPARAGSAGALRRARVRADRPWRRSPSGRD